jgi:hypothetical protein
MNMHNYPHITITEDGSLCSMGQHRPGFPRVLYDALLHLGYNRDTPVYFGRMSTTHGQDRCEVSVMIPLNPIELWGVTVTAAHVALTALCESRLNDTATMPIALFPICKQEEPMWR